ncbi:MAG: PilN domain-containing protein [Syntrophobacteraceae bacterium]|jgi:type IV pilus assembly protein PilN|nr:PilN domain-containing protein [Syntrophobacteraceae bacterium]
MIQINLLPARVRKKRDALKLFTYAYLGTIVLVVAAIGLIWMVQSQRVSSLNAQLARVQSEVSQYAKFDQMLKDIKQQKELVDKKRTVIETLQKDRDSIVRALALLSVQVPPEEVWFERLAHSSNTMTLDGVALSNESIADFMRNLESSPYVEKGSVNLTHSRQKVINNMKLREFQVNYRFYPFSEVQRKLGAQAS